MNQKIDKRIRYFLMLDTETANGIMEENGKLNLNYSLVYDLGLAIVDKRGKVYEQASLVISDIFYDMADIMNSCYYKEKLPRYHEEIADGTRQVVNLYMARQVVKTLMEKYDTNIVIAHNAGFDTGFIKAAADECGMPFENSYLDTVSMSRYVNPELKKHKLDILAKYYELDDFQIQSVTEGREAMGQTVVKLRSGGKLYSGKGISTDIVGASIQAYINALNKIVYEEETV